LLIACFHDVPLRGASADPAFLLKQRYSQSYLSGVADAAQDGNGAHGPPANGGNRPAAYL
jgi:hypothetical protein